MLPSTHIESYAARNSGGLEGAFLLPNDFGRLRAPIWASVKHGAFIGRTSGQKQYQKVSHIHSHRLVES